MRLRGLATISLLVVIGAWAQTKPDPTAGIGSEPEAKQKLTVWRVVPVGPPRPVSVASLSPEVHTQTAGGFGQTAGSFGSPAGSTGKTAGSFGQTAGSVGTTAGSTGQSAGGFGESLDTIANASSASNGSMDTPPAAIAEATGGVAPPKRSDPAWDRLTGEAGNALDWLEVTYEEVGAAELQTRLDAVAGKPEAPDVLIALALPKPWRLDELSGRSSLKTVGDLALIPQTESPEFDLERPAAAVLVRAPHPRAARAYVLWLLDWRANWRAQGWVGRKVPAEAEAPVEVAKNALSSVLSGGGLGHEADREMAPFNGQAAQMMALFANGGEAAGALKIEIEMSSASANERFAVVALRAVVENARSFGLAHAVVVLRTDATGRWKVLQLTPNLRVEQQEVAMRELRSFTWRVRPEQVERFSPVALAAPVDGDIRPLEPDFWWSAPEGGDLEIVEWQRSAHIGWTSSNLYFVTSDNGHVRTRTTGRFADAPGLYRWRVWSMGKGGTVAISSWRSVTIEAR